jgi:two-component system, OmpR family, sensor histidine kinase KdpD
MSASGRSDARRGAPSYEALERVLGEHLGFVWGAVTNVITTTIAFFVAPHAQLAHLIVIHLAGAVLVSTRYGMVISTFTAVTGALAFDYFCIPPIFAFALPDTHSVIIFAGMLGVALLVCWLNQGVRRQRAMARASEARTQTLCELSLDLSQVASVSELGAQAERHLAELFGTRTRLLLGERRDDTRGLQPVGAGDQLFGYISVPADGWGEGSVAERRLLLAACADRIADAFKRLALGEAARQARVDADLERNRNALLSAVSHDMKTPLASILTAATSLLSVASPDPRDSSRELLETIVQEAERMNGLITNLLSVTRLESGAAALNKQPEALDDLIFGALSRFSARFSDRAVALDIPRDLPLLPLDAVLVDQLLVNLLENVLRYTPAGSPVDIHVAVKNGNVLVDVCDRGPGFSPGERDKVFDKFYRGQAAKRNDGGTGLGLTICRAVVRAHDGDISIAARKGGGAVVRFSLPCPLPVHAAHSLLEARRAQA